MGEVLPLRPDHGTAADIARAAAARVAMVLLDLHSHYSGVAAAAGQPAPTEPDDEVVAAWAAEFGGHPQAILLAAAELVIENEPRMVSGVLFGRYIQAAADHASAADIRHADPSACRCDHGWRSAALDPGAVVPCRDCRPEAFRRHVNEWIPKARSIQSRVTGWHRPPLPADQVHEIVAGAKAQIGERRHG